MPSRATMIANALRPKQVENAPDVFSAPKQSWADYVGAAPATGYEGMPAPQAEGMPTHDPDGIVSRIANALATLPTVQSIKEQVMLPRQILSGEKGVPQSFGPATPDAQTDETIGFGLGNAIRPGAAMSIAKMPLAPGEAVLGSGPIRAYHGSPHDFDKFDLSKIGTGEGAQAYGHGLYFAEREGVARDYQNRLKAGTPDGVKPDAEAIAKIDPEWQKLTEQFRASLRDGLFHTPETERVSTLMDALHKQAVDDTVARNPHLLNGRMYEVVIHADPERFLDWDKGGSEIYRKAQDEAALKSGQVGPGSSPSAYKPFEAQASAALREAGIPGIKYLDQGSRGNFAQLQKDYDSLVMRGAPEAERVAAWLKLEEAQKNPGSRNFVLFDDKIVEILRKYGVGSIAALPPAVQMAIQLHQDQTQAEPQEPTFAGKASKMINDLQRKLRGPEQPATPLGMGIRG